MVRVEKNNASSVYLVNVVDLDMSGASSIKVADISYDKKSERATLSFPNEIAPGDAVLAINFTGTMNNAMAGFYRSKYKPAVTPSPDTPKEGDFYYMLSTQFESCDARRAFPCFDEPNLKATFDFEIEVPKGQVALSNMPVKSEREGSKPDLKIVSFERTPVMSTYVSLSSSISWRAKLICKRVLASCLGSRRFRIC